MRVCSLIHTAALAYTYGCISIQLLLRFVKSLFSSVTTLFGWLKSLFTLAKSLLGKQKVNRPLHGLSTSRVKHHHILSSLTIKNGPFHRSFTPVEDVFSIISFTLSPLHQAIDYQRHAVKHTSFTHIVTSVSSPASFTPTHSFSTSNGETSP